MGIHALREEGDTLTAIAVTGAGYISIHALREEGDTAQGWNGYTPTNFYPRPPRGGRQRPRRENPRNGGFLSTPSARRATFSFLTFRVLVLYFYPRPPRGGRLRPSRKLGTALEISIHALREEGDLSLRVEDGDHFYFYPRPPRGGRLFRACWQVTGKLFLSTPSARRATTACVAMSWTLLPFLSTPSARRATRSSPSTSMTRINFYPRPPRGGRLDTVHKLTDTIKFLSTPSARRAT